jgi:hypothetical protein
MNLTPICTLHHACLHALTHAHAHSPKHAITHPSTHSPTHTHVRTPVPRNPHTHPSSWQPARVLFTCPDTHPEQPASGCDSMQPARVLVRCPVVYPCNPHARPSPGNPHARGHSTHSLTHAITLSRSRPSTLAPPTHARFLATREHARQFLDGRFPPLPGARTRFQAAHAGLIAIASPGNPHDHARARLHNQEQLTCSHSASFL